MTQDVRDWDARIHGEGPDVTQRAPYFRNPGNPGARDRDVWQGCFVQDEYHCPWFAESDIILDIGAHIGAFSCLAYTKGSRRVYGYEIDPESYALARRNADLFGSEIVITHAAVVRSDKPAGKMRYNGNWNIFETEGVEVPGYSLDHLLGIFGRVRFLKIDTEGSEWPILYTSKKLDLVQQIAGEYHSRQWVENSHPELEGLPPCTPEHLEKFLWEQGYDKVSFTSQADGSNGDFFAERT